MKILMVCLGNICRSPLADAILNSISSDKIIVDSAGTSDYHIDSLPDTRMINKAKEHGFDLNSLRARQFNSDDFENFDLILTMDKDNYKNVLKKSQKPEHLKKVKLFLSNEMDVPDPYFGKEDGFEEVFKIIYNECQLIVKKIDV
jgi:protein-tyrosine phosphatase